MTSIGTEGGDTGQSLTPPPFVQLYELTTGGWIAQAISVAARLGVADALHEEPRSSEDLAMAVGADPATLYRLLRALTDYGIFQELPGRRFALGEIGKVLRSDHPQSMQGWATMIGARFHCDAWSDLEQAVRTGEPSFARVHGRDVFGYLAEHPDDGAVFDGAMRDISGNYGAGILLTYDFTPFSTIVDVGGGTGALLAAILKAAPASRGILLDHVSVVEEAAGVLGSAGVADRCETVAGDFFECVPDGGALYILSNIVHDWDDTNALRILRSCREAMSEESKLLVIELVLPDDPAPSIGKLVDLEMLSISPNGRQRTAAEYAALLSAAELDVCAVVPALRGEPASYVEAVPVAHDTR